MVNVTSSYYPIHFLLKALSNYLTFALLAAVFILLTGPGIYPQIYHRVPCPAVLILGRGVPNKQHRRGRIVSSFTKGDTFSSFITTKCS